MPAGRRRLGIAGRTRHHRPDPCRESDGQPRAHRRPAEFVGAHTNTPPPLAQSSLPEHTHGKPFMRIIRPSSPILPLIAHPSLATFLRASRPPGPGPATRCRPSRHPSSPEACDPVRRSIFCLGTVQTHAYSVLVTARALAGAREHRRCGLRRSATAGQATTRGTRAAVIRQAPGGRPTQGTQQPLPGSKCVREAYLDGRVRRRDRKPPFELVTLAFFLVPHFPLYDFARLSTTADARIPLPPGPCPPPPGPPLFESTPLHAAYRSRSRSPTASLARRPAPPPTTTQHV